MSKLRTYIGARLENHIHMELSLRGDVSAIPRESTPVGLCRGGSPTSLVSFVAAAD